ncbi:cycloartenol synthase isoform X2 [Gossypium raimondii]|uniref:cycloartenol synthase isoform X2 n=1 Tax=Gossypium raimondii TaxID=29730 RepID=UPI00063AD3BB|nr:cycloartenol synthase isoform X2 [Gossypium raimondii]
MWRLKIGEETVGNDGEWLRSVNNHVGRQVWEFCPQLGTPEKLSQVEMARKTFFDHRFHKKHSFDLFLRIQEKNGGASISKVTVKEREDEREEEEEAIIERSLRRAMDFYSTMQTDDGHWSGDYGGHLFLLPGLVITLYITGALNAVLSNQHQHEICRYIYYHQNRDGGWGLHIEGQSTMFGTTMNYVTLRLLGKEAEGEAAERGREWILRHGTATTISPWGKMWLSVLGANEWCE